MPLFWLAFLSLKLFLLNITEKFRHTEEIISLKLVSLMEGGQRKMMRHSDAVTCLDISGSEIKKKLSAVLFHE